MRLYICHTYYHVYISVLKELYLRKKNGGRGTVLLSTISTDFSGLDKRLIKSSLFEKVDILLERHPNLFEEKFPWKLGQGNGLKKLLIRRKYYQYIVANEEKYINFDFSRYDEIYVFCDSDPIGYYLNGRRISYISEEDGNNSGSYNSVVIANESLFFLKRILAKCNFLYMEDGYSKYSKGYEVNCAEGVIKTGRNVIEMPRESMAERLTQDEREILYQIFKCWETLEEIHMEKPNILILTQPVCTIENRIRLYKKVVDMYSEQYSIIIKPHPIDKVEYEKYFPKCVILQRGFPIEIFNIHCEFDIKAIVTVYSTSLDNLKFTNEKISLGVEFLDEFEEPEKHKDLKRRGNTK